MSCHVRSVIIQGMTRVKGFFSFIAFHLRNSGTECPFVRSRISKGCTLMFLSRIWGACIEIKYYRWGLHAVLYVAILSPISSLVWRYCMRWWCGHKQGRPAASAPSCQGCGLANLIQIQNLEKSTNTNKYKAPGTTFSQPESCWDMKFLPSLPMVCDGEWKKKHPKVQYIVPMKFNMDFSFHYWRCGISAKSDCAKNIEISLHHEEKIYIFPRSKYVSEKPWFPLTPLHVRCQGFWVKVALWRWRVGDGCLPSKYPYLPLS